MSHGASHGARLVDAERAWQLHLRGVASAAIAVRLGVSQRAVLHTIQRRREAEAATNGRASS
ncbi:MAG: hypothetical protein ACRYG8_22635 [Janthinobacterium lividum]